MAMSWGPVPAITSDPAYPGYFFLGWERLLARLIIGEPDTALTSDPAYPSILSPKPFGGLQLLFCGC